MSLVQTEHLPAVQSPNLALVTKVSLDVYALFLMNGFVSLSELSPKVLVTILRDSGASLSMLLEGVLPLSDCSSVHSSALAQGIGMNSIGVPLYAVLLDSDLVKGRVVVRIRSELPKDGVSFILGNDLAGIKILLNLEVVTVPLFEPPDELRKRFPSLFPVCAVTCAMSANEGQEALEDNMVVDLAEYSFGGNNVSPPLAADVQQPAVASAEVVVGRRIRTEVQHVSCHGNS